MPKTPKASNPYEAMTDEELQAASDALGEKRTRVRLEQNACQAEMDLRRAIAAMSGAGRQALILRLTGGVDSGGDADAKEIK